MRKRKVFLSGILAVTMILSITACGGGASKNDSASGTVTSTAKNSLVSSSASAGNASASVEGEEKDAEQYINAFVNADPASIDAQKGSDIYGNVIVNGIYEPLLRLSEKPDGMTELIPAGASEYKVSDDKTVYTFTIRDGMTWEDGQALTAKDYEYGIKRAADPNTAAEQGFLLAPIKNFSKVNSGKAGVDELGVKAIDDKTLEITLEAPTSYFMKLLPFRIMFPQRKDIVEQYGETFGAEADTVMGCGPYKLTEWNHNSNLTLEKSDTYWDKENVMNDTVNIRVMSDVNTVMNAFQTGEIDVVSTSLEEWREKFNSRENTKSAKILLPSVDYMTINHKDKLLSNKKIRQALLIALDRKGFNETFFRGKNIEALHWVPGCISCGDVNYREFAGEPVKKVAEANPDPKKLFIEGMKELGLGEDPSKVEINFICVSNPRLKSFGEYIQECYSKVLGINLKIEQMEWPILSGKVNKGDYQLAYLAWTADYDDPSAMLALFTSNAEAVNTGWKNEKYDNLIKDASEASDMSKAAELYKEAEELLMDEAVVIPIINGESTMYWNDYMRNVTLNQFTSTGYKPRYTVGRP